MTADLDELLTDLREVEQRLRDSAAHHRALAEKDEMDAAVTAARIHGIEETLAAIADVSRSDTLPLKAERRQRRDIRALVKAVCDNPAAAGMTADGIAQEIGCRRSQVEDALKALNAVAPLAGAVP